MDWYFDKLFSSAFNHLLAAIKRDLHVRIIA